MDMASAEPLRDSFERQIDYLRISVTDRCNLRCIYCVPDNGLKYLNQSEFMTSEEITRFVRIAHKHGLRKVRITGGEPLLRDDIVSLISSLRDIGIRDLSVTTNGVKLAGMAEALIKAGLRRVNVSLDTLNAGKYSAITRGGDIRLVWEGIREAEKTGLYPVKINVVPVRGINDDEIPGFASLTFEKDYHIRFIEFMPIGRNRFWNREAFIRKEEMMEKVSALGSLNRLEFHGKGPSRNYRIKGAKGVIGFISPISDCFCDYCNRLRLTVHGRIRPCLFSDMELDIKTPMRKAASDEELAGVFRRAVNAKPHGHHLSRDLCLTGLTSMSEIGG